MNSKKFTAVTLTAITAMSMMSGCGTEKNTEEGKTNITIGGWPTETQPDVLERAKAERDEFEAENPDVNVEGDTYRYGIETFNMKASAGQLPTIYTTFFTESRKIMKAGYAADVTEQMKKYGFDTGINPEILEFVKGEDGKFYGIPYSVYVQGLYVNRRLFKEAGLVNPDGSVMIPETYDDIMEYSKIIREKTGKAGFIFPTTSNCGGWYFLNLAWSFGVDDFCVQREDGTWEAAFDNQAARDALQWLKDMKWEANALLDDTVIQQADIYKWFGTYQGAMTFANPPIGNMPSQFGMEIDDLIAARMPAGPAGRFAQMGGDIYMFSNVSTPDELDAAFRWVIFTGKGPTITDKQIENLKTSYQTKLDKGEIVLDRPAYEVWVSNERAEKTNEVMKEYANIKLENYESYYNQEGVTIRLEPEACCQQLYSVLDKCVQEVIINPDADVDKLISEAAQDYQVNHLDKM